VLFEVKVVLLFLAKPQQTSRKNGNVFLNNIKKINEKISTIKRNFEKKWQNLSL